MSAKNPDFSLSSKKLIVKAVRQVLGEPGPGGDAARGAFPRGATVPNPQYPGMPIVGVALNQIGAAWITAHPLLS